MKSQIEIHGRENNPESEQHLQENAQKFSNRCLQVLEILNTGKRLTVLEAANMGIASLPRRVKDLRAGGFDVLDKWVTDENGKRLYKEYFMKITHRPTKEDVIRAFNEGKLKQGKLL
jgi:hypothetical protein